MEFFQEFVLLFFGVSSLPSLFAFVTVTHDGYLHSWLLTHSPGSAVSDGSFCFQISGSGSAADLFSKSTSPLTAPRGRSQEYDSGNDTSSPPSTQTSSARSRGQEKGSPGGGLSKSRDLNCGNSSDSGNSFTTSSPQNKGAVLENVSPTCRSSESRLAALGVGGAPLWGWKGPRFSVTFLLSHHRALPFLGDFFHKRKDIPFKFA